MSNQQVRPLLSARLPTTSSMAAVLAGDLLAIFAFVATGQISHGYFFWEAPVRTVQILLPAVVGWLVLAIPAGLFVPKGTRLGAPPIFPLSVVARAIPARSSVPTTLRKILGLAASVFVVWIGAALIAGAVRSTSLVPGNAPISFVLVNIVFGALFLVPWRVLVGWRLAR